MVKPETKFWHELKRITPQIKWTRLENSSVFGTPDLLGYNNSGHFFTVELKVTKGVKIRFSPHQIAFHKLHPKNSFILAKQLDNFLVSPTCQNARIQVKLPKGEFRSPDGHFDIKSISLLQNNLIGARESHRIVLEISTQESWKMGKAKRKV